MQGRQRRSLGDRRGALSAARLVLPHGDPARNQGPGSPARPHPQECGLFRGGTLAGWALCVSSGNRQIQWTQLPAVSPATPLRQPRDAETGCGHHRQCSLSPLPPAPTRGGNNPPISLRWTSFPRTVPNAIRSSACGSSHVVVACTIATSTSSKPSSARLNPSSQPGPLATMSSADYAHLLKTLRLISDVDSNVTFSPDGQELAFMRYDNPEHGKYQLIIRGADSGAEAYWQAARPAPVCTIPLGRRMEKRSFAKCLTWKAR
jgi:hypothetical protein